MEGSLFDLRRNLNDHKDHVTLELKKVWNKDEGKYDDDIIHNFTIEENYSIPGYYSLYYTEGRYSNYYTWTRGLTKRICRNTKDKCISYILNYLVMNQKNIKKFY